MSDIPQVEPDERPVTEVVDQPESYPVGSSDTAFDSGRVIAVRTDTVTMPSGDTATRDVVVHPGAVGVIALDGRDRVLMVRQYRHPVRQMLWEAPAGLLDAESDGESAVQSAARELFEETGYRARDWRVLVDIFTSPGMTDEAVRVFLARDLERAPLGERHTGVHEEADMPIAWVPLDEAVRKVLAGELHNPTVVTGVLAAAAARSGSGYDALRGADSPWPARQR